jgi:hypothetical protein
MANEIATNQELEILWFSDTEALCAKNEKAVFIAERSYADRGTIKIAADHRAEVERLGSVVITELGLEFQRWWRRAR